MISIENLFKQIASGEDSSRQFKADVRHAGSLASEMAAFANSAWITGTELIFIKLMMGNRVNR